MSVSKNYADAFPVCVTAFIAPKTLLNFYGNLTADDNSVIITVGVYCSDRSMCRLCNFSNPSKALRYAFMLKDENCPISRHAFALIQAERKRVADRCSQSDDAVPAADDKSVGKDSVERFDAPANSKSVDSVYKRVKKTHPDAIALMRVGDFYECLNDDAQAAADILGITLTHRSKNNNIISLAGFPAHALDSYLPKLVRAGRRVVLCDQSAAAS